MELPKGSIIASGPVIIEDGKVLLNKHGDDGLYKFPGGQVEDFDTDLLEAARREFKEEMGAEFELIRPLSTTLAKKSDGGIAVLVHFLAKRVGEIELGSDIEDWGWFPVDDLPDNAAPNVKPLVEEAVR